MTTKQKALSLLSEIMDYPLAMLNSLDQDDRCVTKAEAVAAITRALESAGQGEGVCHWRQQDESGDWFSTGCGHEFVLNDARQYADGDAPFPFCAYCAKPMRFYRWRDESPCTCDNSDGPECEGCTDNRRCSAISAPQQPEAQAGGEVAGLVGVQRYFPSKPSHAGWEMTADERGEWVLWSDVVAALAHRRATVERHEPSGLDSCQPISWLVKLDGKQFVVHDEATARWWADRLTTQPAQVPEVVVSRQIITPVCRANRGGWGAFSEAFDRVRKAYLHYVEAPQNANVEWHLTLTRVEPGNLAAAQQQEADHG